MKNKNLKPHYDEIIRLNIEEKIGYKKLAQMFNCGKSTIEYIIKSRAVNSGSHSLKKKDVCKNYIKEDPNIAHALRKLEAEIKKKMLKKQIKEYWAKNTEFGSDKNIILPVGLK